MMRQAVGVGVERGVAQRAVLEDHRHRIRRARGLRGKQRRQGRRQRAASPAAATCADAAPAPRGVVPHPQDGVALGRAQDRQGRPARGPASATAAASSRISRSPSASTLDALEQVGPVVEPQLQLLARLHDQRQRIMRRVVALDPAEPAARCAARRKPGAVDRIVLEHHERVEQFAQTRRLLDLGKPDVLVRHQPRLALLRLPQQLRQRQLRRQRHPQRQRVDEQPHHVLDAGKLRRPPRHRHPEHHVVAPGQPAEQDAPGRLQHGVERHRLLARRAIEPRAQRAAERQLDLLGRHSFAPTSGPPRQARAALHAFRQQPASRVPSSRPASALPPRRKPCVAVLPRR